MNKKFLVALVLIILAIFIGGSLYLWLANDDGDGETVNNKTGDALVTQTEVDPYKDWAVTKNDEYGFEFRARPQWIAQPVGPSEDEKVLLAGAYQKATGENLGFSVMNISGLAATGLTKVESRMINGQAVEIYEGQNLSFGAGWLLETKRNHYLFLTVSNFTDKVAAMQALEEILPTVKIN